MLILLTAVAVGIITLTLALDPPQEAHALHADCYETGPITDIEDTDSYYRYSYYYRKQCNYHDSNEQIYQYWFTVTKIYQYYTRTGSYYSTYQYYYTDQTWTLYDREYNEWLSTGSEIDSDSYYYSNGHDNSKWVKYWYDDYYRRYYSYLEYSGSYSYSGCCYADWSRISINGTSWDSLCYPHARATQHYFIENGFPTGNEDGTYYRADRFNYNATIELRRNQGCYFHSASMNFPSTALQIDSCYEYFKHGELRLEYIRRYGPQGWAFHYPWYYPTGNTVTVTTNVCTNADVSVKSNAPYGMHDITASIGYVYPISRYWNHTNQCYGSPWGDCRHPTDESQYSQGSMPVVLATARVVPYDPVFLAYPYLSIADLSKWSYDKQLSLAVHYLGSRDIDGNIYPDRRGIMNGSSYEAYAYQIRKGYGLPTVDPSSTIQHLPSLARIEYKVKITQCYDPNTIAYRSTDNDLYHEEIAVLRSAYFILDLYYKQDKPSDIILNLTNYQLADLTIKGVMKTKAGTIAGKDTATDKEVGSFEYVYPARSFLRSVSLRVVTEDQQGNLVPKPIHRIKVEFIPHTGEGYWDLYTYLQAKYNYDIARKNNGVADPQLVQLIFCVEDADNTYQPITIERYNTDHVAFLDRFHMLYIPDSALRVFQVDHMLQIPLEYALQASTPMNMRITIQTNPLQQEISNIYTLPAYQQYSVYQQDIFLGFGIWTDKHVKRYGDKIVVTPPTHFKIHSMEVNIDHGISIFPVNNCMIGCTVTVGNGSVLAVMHNEWNALALAYYPPLAVETTAEDPYIGWTMFAVTVLVSFTVLMLLKYFRGQINRM